MCVMCTIPLQPLSPVTKRADADNLGLKYFFSVVTTELRLKEPFKVVCSNKITPGV